MKIAVFFPGIGYHVDKPLLYYAKKIVLKHGYEVIDVPYGNFPGDVKGSAEKMLQVFESALAQAEEILEAVSWGAYEDVLFVSKSVGTAVAAAYGTKYHIKTRNVFFTPVEQSFVYMRDPGVVFTGTADPWVKEGSITRCCKEKDYPVIVIDGGNHSLEVGDVQTDLDNLKMIMGHVENYIGR